jgi:hypothetical protein
VGSDVKLEAEVTEHEDTAISDSKVVWRSQLDGELGHGRDLKTNKLRPGVHELTCTATDSFGVSGSAKVELVVRSDPPSVQILSPQDGASFQGGDKVQLMGAASAAVQGNLDGDALTWLEDDGKKIATGKKVQLDASKLGFGEHVLSLRAKDKWGAEATVSIHVTVVRRPLEVAITSPADGASFAPGTPVVFTGTARDLDRNKSVDGSRLSWSDVFNASSAPLGTGAKLSLDSLAPGVHQITLTASDPDDASLSRAATVRIRILAPTPPDSGVAGTSSTSTGAPSTTPGIIGALGTTPSH